MMIQAFIIGPGPATEHTTAKMGSPKRSDQEVLDIFAKQIAVLNKAGISQIDILDRSLHGKVRYRIDGGARLILFIRFDAVLEPELLYHVSKARTDSVVVTKVRTSHLTCREPIEQHEGQMTGSGSKCCSKRDTQEEFHGVIALQANAAQAFLDGIQHNLSASMSDVLGNLCECHDIRVQCWSQDGGEATRRSGGGSYARSDIVTRFRKEAKDRGRRKLRDEIRFLKNLPGKLKALYPHLYDSGETDDTVFLELEYLPFSTLRHQLFTGKMTAEAASVRLEYILETLYENAFAAYAWPCPADYLEQFHFQRVWHRLKHTIERAPVFLPLFDAQSLWINGQACRNVPELLRVLENSEQAQQRICPRSVSPFIHGDLHFENIMVDPESDAFRLVDPRGYDYCDIFYDLGKISHSTNGKYDFIHESRFSVNWEASGEEIDARLTVDASPLLQLYEDIDAFMRPLYRNLTGDPQAELKALFAEAVHFCTMMPFHLKDDGKEDKAIAIFLTGVRLLNDLVEKLNIPKQHRQSRLKPEEWGSQDWRNVG